MTQKSSQLEVDTGELQTPPGLERASTIVSLDPRTDEVVGTYPIVGAQEISLVLEKAQAAAKWWESLGFSGRKKWLLEWKKALAKGARELASVISKETGKPIDDAFLEVMLTIEHLDWAAKNAEKVLGRKKVPSGLVSANQAASVQYQPIGVIGVIGPWNYPLYTPMGSISYALAAGNSVIFKPSELTPGVGVWIAQKWAELVPHQPILQVITGDGATGGALCSSGVDKIAFTGSTATAKRVMAACAGTLTPLVAECGGKDAMLVDSDADIDAAAGFAVFGAFGNSGQTCVGVERIYAVEAIYDKFLAAVIAKTKLLKPGADSAATYGPMTMPQQSEIVSAHIQDALNSGGRAVFGGIDSVRPPYISPVILVDVPENSEAVCEETFGPTVVINKVVDLEEAVERANSGKYGLGASIFSGNKTKAMRVAEQLHSGVVTINSVLGFAGVAALPFGGVGQSGFGRIHGADGLREFTNPKSIARQKYKAPLDLLTLERKKRVMTISGWMLKVRHG
ncbi:MAG: aldehyde dehydrogenase family protein [Mycobacteriaceae bacterium]